MIVEGFLTKEQMIKYKGGGDPESIENIVPLGDPLKTAGVITDNDLSEFFGEEEEFDKG